MPKQSSLLSFFAPTNAIKCTNTNSRVSEKFSKDETRPASTASTRGNAAANHVTPLRPKAQSAASVEHKDDGTPASASTAAFTPLSIFPARGEGGGSQTKFSGTPLERDVEDPGPPEPSSSSTSVAFDSDDESSDGDNNDSDNFPGANEEAEEGMRTGDENTDGVRDEFGRQLSEYELLRLRNIDRNNKRLAQLGLIGSPSSTLIHVEEEMRRTKHRKRQRVGGDTTRSKVPVMPTRRSTRNRRSVLQGSTEELSIQDHIFSYQDVHAEEEPEGREEEELFTISPVLGYEISDDSVGVTNDVGSCSNDLGTSFETSVSPEAIACLKPMGNRLCPPNGLGAIYTLQFYPKEWCPMAHADDRSWLVGAGKAGIISLWDFSWAPTCADVSEDDRMVNPILSWKAHGGRWVADAHFLPAPRSGGDISRTSPSRLLSAANDGSICLWDLSAVSVSSGAPKLLCRTGKELHRSGIFSMDVNVVNGRDYQVATGSKDKSVAISTMNSIATGRGAVWVSDYHSAKVGAVALERTGTTLVASASDDGYIAVQDYRSNGKKQVVAELGDAHFKPHSVAWNPLDKNFLMTAGLDNEIKIFDIRSSHRPVSSYLGHVPSNLGKYKRIHRPVFYNPCRRSSKKDLFSLSGGERSYSISMFRNSAATQSVISVYSRGKLPSGSGDAGCLAVQGERVACAVDGGEVLLLAPQLKVIT